MIRCLTKWNYTELSRPATSLTSSTSVVSLILYSESFIAFAVHTTKGSNELISATEDGKAGFLSVDDIAELAVDALTVEKTYNTDFIMVGPELLSFDEVHTLFLLAEVYDLDTEFF